MKVLIAVPCAGILLLLISRLVYALAGPALGNLGAAAMSFPFNFIYQYLVFAIIFCAFAHLWSRLRAPRSDGNEGPRRAAAGQKKRGSITDGCGPVTCVKSVVTPGFTALIMTVVYIVQETIRVVVTHILPVGAAIYAARNYVLLGALVAGGGVAVLRVHPWAVWWFGLPRPVQCMLIFILLASVCAIVLLWPRIQKVSASARDRFLAKHELWKETYEEFPKLSRIAKNTAIICVFLFVVFLVVRYWSRWWALPLPLKCTLIFVFVVGTLLLVCQSQDLRTKIQTRQGPVQSRVLGF